ncbi:MAG TPA: hypothetical protein VMR34_05065 [Candidatus Saccharimonadales bacterium]|nr:hypothetical protein [Candidatus Saccharimonadales bacterium]
MSETSGNSSKEVLTEDQVSVLDENTRLVLETGLVRYYLDALEAEAGSWERLSANPDDEMSARFKATADGIRAAASAELPFAFNVRPGNLEKSVNLFKVDPKTGNPLDYSEAQVGLTGKVNEGGAPNGQFGFTGTDLDLALVRLQEQEQHGLAFAPQRGFLSDLPTSA